MILFTYIWDFVEDFGVGEYHYSYIYNGIAFFCSVILCILRDGMFFPYWVSCALVNVVLAVTCFQLFQSTFLSHDEAWLLLIRKVSHIQIVILLILIDYSLFYFDKEQKSFVLIVDRVDRSFLFYQNINYKYSKGNSTSMRLINKNNNNSNKNSINNNENDNNREMIRDKKEMNNKDKNMNEKELLMDKVENSKKKKKKLRSAKKRSKKNVGGKVTSEQVQAIKLEMEQLELSKNEKTNSNSAINVKEEEVEEVEIEKKGELKLKLVNDNSSNKSESLNEEDEMKNLPPMRTLLTLEHTNSETATNVPLFADMSRNNTSNNTTLKSVDEANETDR